MCGIYGSLSSRNVLHGFARDWQQRLHHRGPDAQGYLLWSEANGFVRDGEPGQIDARLLLGHTRLAIQDLSAAASQPMSTPDDQLHMVFNGEVYNFLELRAELAVKGHCFHTGSDTEVVLQAYRQWGCAAFARFRGMFALAIFDLRRRELVLARDAFGIKPLYYSHWQAGLAFASEPGVLLTLPGVTAALHAQAVYDYLGSGLTDQGEATLLADVCQLPAASYAVVPLDREEPVSPQRYWQPGLRETFAGSFNEAASQLRSLFLDSVNMHLRSDVPVGTCLSGGIDSSSIVCVARELAPEMELQAFSYIADDPALNEERWIDQVAVHAGVSVHKTIASEQGLARDLTALMQVQGEPFGSTSIYAQYQVFRAAGGAGMKVMLDGQGADELLGGYLSHQTARLTSLISSGRFVEAWRYTHALSHHPGRSVQRLVGAVLPMIRPRLPKRWRQWRAAQRSPGLINARWQVEHGVDLYSGRHPVRGRNALRRFMLETLECHSVPKLLRYEDRNSMAFSVESRVPFLTQEMADFCLNLPENFLIGPDGETKRVFRAAMRGIVPDAILDRRDKIGFSTPEKRWLMQMPDWVESRLAMLAGQPMVNMDQVLAIWRGMQAGQIPFNWQLWRLLNLAQWLEQLPQQHR